MARSFLNTVRPAVIVMALACTIHMLVSDCAAVEAGAASPIAKISDTLTNLLQSVEAESAEDVGSYKSVYGWCQQSFAHRKKGQQHFAQVVNELSTKITVQTAFNRQLKDEIQELEKEIGEQKDTVSQGSNLRGSEHTDYLAEQKDAANMLTTLNRAVDVLSKSSSRATLISVANSVRSIVNSNAVNVATTADQKQSLNDFLASLNGNSAGTAAGLESVDGLTGPMAGGDSDGNSDAIGDATQVQQTLRELIQTFQRNIATASDQERGALDQYDGLIKLKRDGLVELVSSKDAKDALLAESLQKTAQLKRSLTDAKNLAEAGKQYLVEIKKVCNTASNGWAGKSQVYQDIIAHLQGVDSALQQALQSSLTKTGDAEGQAYMQSSAGSANSNGALRTNDPLNIGDVLDVSLPGSAQQQQQQPAVGFASFLQVSSKASTAAATKAGTEMDMDMDMSLDMALPDAAGKAAAARAAPTSTNTVAKLATQLTPIAANPNGVAADANAQPSTALLAGTSTVKLMNTNADPLEAAADNGSQSQVSLRQA
jgi:hypothetical protein